MSAESYLHSDNLIARLNLPNMAYPAARKLEIFGQALNGLFALESDPERQVKYLDFIDIYAQLDDNERQAFEVRYPREGQAMSGFAERFTERGLQRGEAAVLMHQMERKVGVLTQAQRQRIEAADAETLLSWSERILVAQSPDEVLR